VTDRPKTASNRTAIADDGRDRELLDGVRRRDRAAFQELYVKYYHLLLRFVYRITGQLESAQEGVNDVMLVIWQSAAGFEGKSRVSTWILGIAYRKALKLRQGARRWTERFKAGDADSDELSARSSEHIDRTDLRDLRDLLDHGMRKLPAKQRAVVELTYFYGYSYEEIAAIVDCPVNTVKTRMFHARARLKSLLPALGKDDL
jgi:RNA polymerase sigma-70 factor (ECF subfamily)